MSRSSGPGGVVVLESAATIVGSELSGASVGERFIARAIRGFGVVFGAVGIASSLLIESPIEWLTTVWRRDPGLIHIRATVAPTVGGATLGFWGTF